MDLKEVIKSVKQSVVTVIVCAGIAICGCAYILLIYEFGAVENLVAYVTFALAVSSLLLSLISIFHSMQSNRSTVNSQTKLAGTSNDLSQATQTLIEVANRIESDLSSIPQLSEGINRHTERLDEIKEIMASRNTSESTDNPAQPNEMATRFLSNVDISSLIIFEAGLKAHERGHWENLQEIFDDNEHDKGHFVGIVLTLAALGLEPMMDVFSIEQIEEAISTRQADFDADDVTMRQTFEQNMQRMET